MSKENQENQELVKKRMDEHTAHMKQKFEDTLNRTAILKALDLVALEALRLEIPDWETMKIGHLRSEIKKRQDAEKKAKELKP